MNKYELTYLLPVSLSENEIVKESEKIKKILGNGKIIEEKALGKRKLSYPIKKGDFGYYTNIVFEFEPEEIKKIDSEIKMQENILRHLIVSAKETPKPIEKKEEKVEEKLKVKPPTSLKLRGASKKAVVAKTKLKKPEPVEEKIKELDEKLEEILKE